MCQALAITASSTALLLSSLGLALVAGCSRSQPPAADADMQAVLDAQAALHPKPIEKLTPTEARRQPTPTDGVQRVLQAQGRSSAPIDGVLVEEVTYPGGAGPQKARIYKSIEGDAAKPLVLYFRGGGWVIADLDVYDATPRSLAKQLKAVVVSADYSMGPERRFPAAHDDAVAAYRWVLSMAASWGGDAKRIAVAGESAGGNLAANVSIAARDRGLPLPIHELLVYPVASTDTTSPSYVDRADAKPLNAAMMGWFVQNATNGSSDLADPRLDLVAADLHGLPPTTIISADIDPLRSDADALTERLEKAGVPVEHRLYRGVTHEFFGMAAVVEKAQQAQTFAVARLTNAFAAHQ